MFIGRLLHRAHDRGCRSCQACPRERAANVTVVIPSWNSLGLLPRCLDSLRDQGGVGLLVVDNGSTDGTSSC